MRVALLSRRKVGNKIQSVSLRPDGAEARSWERKPRVAGQNQQYRSTSETENRSSPTCYLCGKEGHIKRYCPLNFNGPTGKVNGRRPGNR